MLRRFSYICVLTIKYAMVYPTLSRTNTHFSHNRLTINCTHISKYTSLCHLATLPTPPTAKTKVAYRLALTNSLIACWGSWKLSPPSTILLVTPSLVRNSPSLITKIQFSLDYVSGGRATPHHNVRITDAVPTSNNSLELMTICYKHQFVSRSLHPEDGDC